jgi:multidrug efflux pump subunit AcrA (membrane-fusion protein)
MHSIAFVAVLSTLAAPPPLLPGGQPAHPSYAPNVQAQVQPAHFGLPRTGEPTLAQPQSAHALPVRSYVAPASTSQPIVGPVGKQVQITHCLVSLIEDIQAPALEAGALTSVEVSEGQYVEAGQRIATIDDRQAALQKRAAELERDAAKAKAADDIEVRYAKAALDVASADLERALSIERRNAGAVTPQEIQKLRLAKRRDELQIDRSKLELHVAGMNADVHQAAVDAADEAIARRQIVSPIDGIVVTLFHERGEWVNAGEPVAQIVRIDRLRVEGFVNAAEHSPADLAGQQVVVEVPLANQQLARFVGNVVFISPLVQAGNKYRVRAEVENRTEKGHPLLRPGMTANMTIGVP